MSRYRKIDVRIWNDEKFRSLSDNGKLVFLFLLTHPNMTALGAMRATISGLAEELGWEREAFCKAFEEALAEGMAEFDATAHFVALPRFLKYNGPESPNVVKAWLGSFDLLPECELKCVLIQRAKGFTDGLTEAFREAFGEAFTKALSKGMPYQEQEQEPETGTEKNQKLSFNEGMKRKGFSNTSEVENLLPQRREVLSSDSSDGNEPTDPSTKVLGSRDVTQLSPSERLRAAMKRVEEKERKAHTPETVPPTGSTWSELQSRKGVQTSAH